MFNSQRRRTSSISLPGPVIAIIGVVIVVVGIVVWIIGHRQQAAIASDPSCVAALTVDTPAATDGKKCKIHAGTVTKAFEEQKITTRRDSSGNQHRETSTIDHIVVTDDAGKTYDVDVGDSSSDPVYTHAVANNGTKAKVETIDDDPVYVATSAGMASSSSHDPGSTTTIGIVVLIIGVLVGGFGVVKTLFFRRR